MNLSELKMIEPIDEKMARALIVGGSLDHYLVDDHILIKVPLEFTRLMERNNLSVSAVYECPSCKVIIAHSFEETFYYKVTGRENCILIELE